MAQASHAYQGKSDRFRMTNIYSRTNGYDIILLFRESQQSNSIKIGQRCRINFYGNVTTIESFQDKVNHKNCLFSRSFLTYNLLKAPYVNRYVVLIMREIAISACKCSLLEPPATQQLDSKNFLICNEPFLIRYFEFTSRNSPVFRLSNSDDDISQYLLQSVQWHFLR